jgi:ADP-ribosylglycohydrolase
MCLNDRGKISVSPYHVQAILEAFAAGDAFGMPAEFMTRREIHERFGIINRLLEPFESRNHPDLPKGSVTDDTGQVLALLDEYILRGRVDPRDTAMRLLQWMRESGAVEKRYIGPSSKSALEAIKNGADPIMTGTHGTTCGGVMRSPAAVLYSIAKQSSSSNEIADAVQACLMPTHNTHEALESAIAYSFALVAAIKGGDVSDIVQEVIAGAAAGAARAPWQTCGASPAARVLHFLSIRQEFNTPESVLDFLYEVYGTGLDSVDVATAALCIFLFGLEDTWLCIRMGASIGGDTDTIAALAGALSAAYRFRRLGSTNIPPEIFKEIQRVNGLDLEKLSNRLF